MIRAVYAVLFSSVLGLLIISCGGDDSNNNNNSGYGPSVNATESIFDLNIFDVPVYSPNNTKRNRGYEFKTSIDGRITHLGAKISKGTYAVTLWDSAKQVIISSVNVTNTDSTQYAYADIADIEVKAGKAYVVTVYNVSAGGITQRNIWYSGITSSINYFPKAVGQITFMAYVETNAENASQLFPYTFGRRLDVLLGFPSFKFEPQK